MIVSYRFGVGKQGTISNQAVNFRGALQGVFAMFSAQAIHNLGLRTPAVLLLVSMQDRPGGFIKQMQCLAFNVKGQLVTVDLKKV